MPYCRACGNQVREGHVFCTRCGASLTPVPPAGVQATSPPAASVAPSSASPAVPPASAPRPRRSRVWLVIGVTALLLIVLAGAGGAAAWFLLGPGGSRTGAASVSGSDPASLGFDTVPGEQMGSASGAGSTGAAAQDATTSAEDPATP